MSDKILKNPFPSARDEVKKNRAKSFTKPLHGNAYELAFLDHDFLLREELRPVRLQLELLKPDLIQREQQVEATVVVFGSARIKSPTQSRKEVKAAKEALAKDPNNPKLKRQLAIAQSLLKKSVYYDEARKLGRIVAEMSQHVKHCDFVIVTGAGPGIMEAANRGSYDMGAKSVGLSIVLPHEEEPNKYITPELTFKFHYFAIRKMHFLVRARALVAFPGGFGTLDELFETLTLMQTGKISLAPVILVGRKYWEKLINFQGFIEEGVINEEDLKLINFVETAVEAWDVISDFYHLPRYEAI